MHNKFENILLEKINKDFNSSPINNYDYYRFGPEKQKKASMRRQVAQLLFNKVLVKKDYQHFINKYNELLNKYGDGLERLYHLLEDDYSKNILVEIIAYKILGSQHVKLSRNTPSYWNSINDIEKLKKDAPPISVGFKNWNLYKYDLSKIDIPIEIYLRPPGILHEIISQQYAYKDLIQAEDDDIVLDAGACWGDSALYFANKLNDKGKVYSFEFIPGNKKIFDLNLKLNESLKSKIKLIEQPLWDTSNKDIFFKDNGPGSKVSFEKFDGYDGTSKTISIDDFVNRENLTSVNFIKMDIEGAEPYALKGAEQTIRKLKPKLAISVYHSLDDLVNIPEWINNLNMKYKLYMDHYTIHWEETVLFAK